MGRAQVVQAQAAGLTPHIDMNPILLKPCSDVGSQVIVQGKVYGNMAAQEYYRHKPRLVQKVMTSFRRLSESYELIILEGAGSAVELNLKKNDLVNFSMAKRANAAVLLVADIDRGGVFAATIGTFHLLTPKERRLLGGFIINKFRGDATLFQEGVRIIETRTRRPVLGLVPFARDLNLPQEDSVALDRKMCQRSGSDNDCLNIGVLRLPHISNYTDFDPLEQEPGVRLSYLDQRYSLKNIDLLILPGTKNTISDLLHLKGTGLFSRIKEYAALGGRLIGICGGYQILGQVVKDPLGVEGETPEEEGLGLLPVVTTMAGEKTTTQVEARAVGLPGNDHRVSGYEIHMGLTEMVGPGQPVFEINERLGVAEHLADGWSSPDGRIWGSYIHGLFDNDGFRQTLLRQLSEAKGLIPSSSSDLSFTDFQESQFDQLADLVRRHVDIDRIRGMIQV
jgi:adenosylcobyric acid synthase